MNKILLLEDEESVSRGICFTLEKARFCVYPCRTIREAACVLEEDLPQMLICDLTLPDGSGQYTSQQHFDKNVADTDKRYTVLFQLGESVSVTRENAKTVIEQLAANCGIVILCSAVVIYNIFQVGVVQKVQEYGKLKAIGATRRQMRQVVFREGMYLACMGVPIGLLAGLLWMETWHGDSRF